MAKKNLLGKFGFISGLILAIVFGLLFVGGVLFTLLMAVGAIGVFFEAPTMANLITDISILGCFVINCLFFGAIAVAGIIMSVLTRRYDMMLKKYLTVIASESKIEAIATIMGKNYDEVKKTVKKIIDRGYLKNAYLNESTGEVVFNAPDTNVTSAGAANDMDKNERVVICPGCGAKNIVSGAVGECEFCGTPLK